MTGARNLNDSKKREMPIHRDEFIAAFQGNCEGTRKEPGNLRFDLLCDPKDENSFSVYEIFEDEAALETHRETLHYRRCVALISPSASDPRTTSCPFSFSRDVLAPLEYDARLLSRT